MPIDGKNEGSTEEASKNEIIIALTERILALEKLVHDRNDEASTLYSSRHALATVSYSGCIPQDGLAASHVAEMITQYHSCDFNPRLNTSSYVNVVSEPEEREVALMGATVNLADASVYPASVGIHDTVVNMIAKLWNAPRPNNHDGNYVGAGTGK
jgi:glutamate decarboxylase